MMRTRAAWLAPHPCGCGPISALLRQFPYLFERRRAPIREVQILHGTSLRYAGVIVLTIRELAVQVSPAMCRTLARVSITLKVSPSR